ncbi:MAG TPA: rod shape-determining protein MreC [Burkholderiaceae bacterium]|nr:rod shape-determining protein MreC [Burkholderiaceae bacterium]
MDRSPPPFFKQGPSANARLAFFAVLSIALLIVDTRLGALGPLRQGIGTVLYPLQRTLLVPRDAVAFAGDYLFEVTRLRQENSELRRLEMVNAKALLQAEQIEHENRKLRELLGARERVAVRSLVAEVLYDTRDPFTRKLVLDKGLQHGVAAGQPVIDATGVIGQITRVFPMSSELTLVTDRSMTVPVQIQRNGLRSVAFGGAAPGRMELRYMAVNADIREGDVLATSGLDNLYPAGLPVGRVLTIDKLRSGSFSRIIVEPVAGVDRSRMLLILLSDQSAAPPMPALESIEGRKRARRD